MRTARVRPGGQRRLHGPDQRRQQRGSSCAKNTCPRSVGAGHLKLAAKTTSRHGHGQRTVPPPITIAMCRAGANARFAPRRWRAMQTARRAKWLMRQHQPDADRAAQAEQSIATAVTTGSGTTAANSFTPAGYSAVSRAAATCAAPASADGERLPKTGSGGRSVQPTEGGDRRFMVRERRIRRTAKRQGVAANGPCDQRAREVDRRSAARPAGAATIQPAFSKPRSHAEPVFRITRTGGRPDRFHAGRC